MAHIPRKRFGQNFLHDHHIVSRIFGTANPRPDQHWVEIGPGQGALTEPLLQSGVKLDLVELDRDLVAFLERRFGHYPNLTIHSCDALRFDFSRLAEANRPLHVIGNLPYNISTPLLFHLLASANDIAEMLFMLQKEVVERICAVPGSKKYGRLSIMIQYHCDAELLFYVPPESFEPAPKVMSAVVKLVPYRQLPHPAVDTAVLNKVVSQAFSQRRKTLRNALKSLFSEQELIDLDIAPDLRPESVTVEDYINLAQLLAAKQRCV